MRTSAIFAVAVVQLGACIYTGAPSEVRTRAPEAAVGRTAPESDVRPSAPPREVRTRARESALRIDSTSLASFRATWQQLYSSLSSTERANLDVAAARIAFSPYGGVAHVPQSLRNSPIVPEMVRQQIDGMTYSQIIEHSGRPVEREESPK